MADENVGTISYTLDAKTEALVSSNKQAQTSLNSVESSLDGTANSSKRLDTQLTKTASSTKKANAGIRQMRGNVQNLSYQLQDAVVQAQMGTSAFVILGQQAPQALGSFGAGGAALGVLVALGAALGGVVSKAMDAGESAKNYNDEIELLTQTVEVSEKGIVSFSDKFGRLADSKPQNAISKVRDELSRIESISRILSRDTKELLEDSFDVDTSQIEETAALFKNVGVAAEDLKNILNGNQGAVGADVFVPLKELNILDFQVSDLADSFKITKSQAVDLASALSDIDSVEGIKRASDIINDLAKSTAGSSLQIDRLNVAFSEASEKSDNLSRSKQALSQILLDIDIASKKTATAIDKLTEADEKALSASAALSDRIALQNVAMTQGEEAAARLAAEQALGNDVSDALKSTVGDLAVEYYRLVTAQKEAAKAATEQTAIDRRADAVANQANLTAMSEIEQIKAKAQAQRDLINSSKALNDAEKSKALGSVGANEQDRLNQENFGTTDPKLIGLQETLNVSKEVAQEIDTIDQKFQNLGTTMSDTLVGAAYSFADAAGQGMAQAIADGDNLNDTLRNVASTIGVQLLGSLITMGLQYGINAALATAAGTAVTAATAAQATATQVAWAPAALSASIATLGGATTTGAAAYSTAMAANQGLSLAGGRLNGGPVSAGSAYEVTEDGKPEMLTVGGKNILMMGSQGGKVTSNKDMMSSGGSGGGVVVNIQNNASGSEATATSREQDGKTIIDVVVADLNSRGKIHKTMTNTTTANNRV